MAGEHHGEQGDLPAGGFSAWLGGMRSALRGERDADVPCDGCTACCRSAQFVHIAPDETDTLAHVPPELLFPAPRLPAGHVVLGYDDQGRCPMLGDDGCSIYDHRPGTCRTYDCRIFAATGLQPQSSAPIAERVRRWRFEVATGLDQAEQDAVRAAARFVQENATAGGPAPANPARLAVLAIESSENFSSAD